MSLKSARPLRFVSAASLFDGHDAAINMIRRLLQAHGAEVVHLGHNRSVADIVRAALQEDADGIAVSSYQGGHNEYFTYMVDMLRDLQVSHIKVIVGGGGTIAPEEISALERYGIEKIYTPEDGRRLGLDGMIDDVFARVRAAARPEYVFQAPTRDDQALIARSITALEGGSAPDRVDVVRLRQTLATSKRSVPVIGITGTGGAGKSSLTDELLQRFVRSFPDRQIAVVAIDPTRRRSGGALLGDRIRMNALVAPSIFMRSLATRREHLATSAVLREVIELYACAGFDLVLVETAGIGQSDTEIVDLVDLPLYVMTSEYGAASQLEKIDMLDFAALVVLNKFEKRGAEDALRDVRKQWRRNHPESACRADAEMPVYPTIASRFNDPGVNRLFAALLERLDEKSIGALKWRNIDGRAVEVGSIEFTARDPLIPAARSRYLAEISGAGRRLHEQLVRSVAAARQAYSIYEALKAVRDPLLPEPLQRFAEAALAAQPDNTGLELRRTYHRALDAIGSEGVDLLKAWPARLAAVTNATYEFTVRNKSLTGDNFITTMSNNQVPKIVAPGWQDWGELLQFLVSENLPGSYPYTGGVYPYRREAEDPIRMFAGEGSPERTNRRFHLLARDHAATRLSTAFDSTTLYGEDPDTRPDIYGRTGNSGVSVATVDDMKKLYSGFDLCLATTSVSMTINGPAPMILAMFLNTAIDQRVEQFLKGAGRWDAAQRRIALLQDELRRHGLPIPYYSGPLPPGHDGSGLALLGLTAEQLVAPGVLDSQEFSRLRSEALAMVRGTVQADILKEDQAQNTCIFSTEFALRMMGDVQQFFIDHKVRNFYSVSISGYHIAEAGANPVSQLAFTLANGFTIVEYYLARGMKIDEFAANLSFFFSNGMDAEYAVIGRVARRIWARAMRDVYHADARSQMLKYHIQTSGRSLHAQEIQFNDIRTTLQALYALFDNCNSLHTNAYDEALTTPTEESVRRAVAIQLIINRELGLNANQNPWAGSFLMDYLTNMVEEAVYKEFDALSERGGVLGAMESMYQRGKIQAESLYYETRKHDGTLPLIGVNTFLAEQERGSARAPVTLIRSSEDEKQAQVRGVRDFSARHTEQLGAALQRLQRVAASGGNVFTELMSAVQVCTLGQVSHALYGVGGQYRRSV